MKGRLPLHPSKFAARREDDAGPALDEVTLGRIARRELSFAQAAGLSSERLVALWELALGLIEAGHFARAADVFGGLAAMSGPSTEIDMALAGCFASLGDRSLALSHLNHATNDGRPEIQSALAALASDLGFERGQEGRWR